jgi:UDPglucose 6-dehydrogenase
MKKNISLFGTGYVGLVTALGLVELGHEVTAVDIDLNRIKDLKKGYLPFYEPGLKKILKKALTAGKIHFTDDGELAANSNDVIFIAVGTPAKEDGRVELSYIRKVFDTVMENLLSSKTIVIKSTVPPGTTESLIEQYSLELEETKSHIVFFPEFLREGSALHDFFHPDRLVIGSDSDKAAKVITEILYPLISSGEFPVLKCSPVSAEMIKYSSNIMLAARIALINELAELSESVGGDIRDIAAGIGSDSRIGAGFLKSGPGFGGSCFGKDLSGLYNAGRYRGVELGLVREILNSNEKQKLRPALKAEQALHTLRGKKIAVLGLSFKADTDDVRGSAAFEVIDYLLRKGAQVKAHDPAAEYNFIREFKKKGYNCVAKAEDALRKADAVIVLTDWTEYAELKPETFNSLMKGHVIIDSRNLYKETIFGTEGITVSGTGRRIDKAVKASRSAGDFVNAAIVSI